VDQNAIPLNFHPDQLLERRPPKNGEPDCGRPEQIGIKAQVVPARIPFVLDRVTQTKEYDALRARAREL